MESTALEDRAQISMSDDSPPSLDTVEAARRGDEEAFEQLYRANAGRVYALCLRLSGDPSLAEELVQQAFVRAWEKLPSFRGEAAFSSWLHRLTVNVVLGHRRSRHGRLRLVQAEEPAEAADSAAPRPGLAMDLERAIRSLPAQARHVLVLHDIEGFRHREIAAMLEIAEGTSKAHLHRARTLLRERLP